MLNIKALTLLALVSCFTASPFSIKGESTGFATDLMTTTNTSQIIDTSLRCREVRKFGKRIKNRPLELSDFEGQWVVSAQSVGGLSGPDKIGNALSITGQMTVDRHGKGIINYGVITKYQGTPGETENSIKDKLYDLEIEILDAKKGVAILRFDGPLPDPIVKSISTYFSVVNRSKKTGKVLEVTGQRINREPATETYLLSMKMNRQYGTY